MRLAVALIVLLAIARLDAQLVVAADVRAKKMPRIAVLEPGVAPGASCLVGFQQGMRELGYFDGRTVVIDLRYADNSPDRLAALAADLVRQAPGVFWTHSSIGARTAAHATKTIPIVSGEFRRALVFAASRVARPRIPPGYPA